MSLFPSSKLTAPPPDIYITLQGDHKVRKQDKLFSFFLVFMTGGGDGDVAEACGVSGYLWSPFGVYALGWGRSVWV